MTRADGSISVEEFRALQKKAGGGKGSGGRHQKGVMNKTEEEYAGRLALRRAAGEIVGWLFEAAAFELANRCTYTPDFLVLFPDGRWEVHETKGEYEREDGILKLKFFKARHPGVRVLKAKKGRGGWKTTEIRA
jgi:hypothetical protein